MFFFIVRMLLAAIATSFVSFFAHWMFPGVFSHHLLSSVFSLVVFYFMYTWMTKLLPNKKAME